MNRRASTIALAIAASVTLLSLPGPASAAGPTLNVTGTVSSGKAGLTVRAAASAASAAVGTLRNGAKVTLACSQPGPKTKGRVRTTDRWDRMTNGRYVSDAYIKRGGTPAACPPPPRPAPVASTPPAITTIVPPVGAVPLGTWVAPVPGRGTGGFRTPSRPEHDGVDMMAARQTPIRAVAAGTVVTVKCNTSGTTCDVDGGPNVSGCGWYVEIQHAGSIVTRYCHMVRQPAVIVGQSVPVGQTIGFVGTSGHSSGPHLHFEVHFGARPANRLNAIDPVEFMRRARAPIA